MTASISNKGVFEASLSIVASTSPVSIDVGHLRDVTIQVVRTGSTDTIAVTGRAGGATNVAVTSDTQVATGGDTALSAISSGVYTIRQKVKTLVFTASGSVDTFAIYVIGLIRR